MNTIPPFDVAEQFQQIGPEINQAVLEVLASGRYIGGAAVEQFESQFAAYTGPAGTAQCIACNSGTDALYLALRALGLGVGDEVITTPFTFIATAETISATGATPVFVDIDPVTFNLDLAQVQTAITPRTKAILPVHLFGQAVDMTQLMAIAQAHQLYVVEDCAQATGTEWDHRKVGSMGHVGCFSFYPTKNLGACGDGGAIVTSDPAVADRLRVLRDHGRSGTYYYEQLGVNSRLDAIQAVILQIKLRHLDHWIEQRTAVAQRYHQHLQALPGLILPTDKAGGKSSWNQYTLRVESGQRDLLRSHLASLGVTAMVYYPLCLHLQPAYHNLGHRPGAFPEAELASQQVLSLPMFPELSWAQQDQVIAAVQHCLTQAVQAA